MGKSTRYQSSKKEDEDSASSVSTDKIVKDILQELTHNDQYKSLLQTVIENVIERKLAKISDELEKQEVKIFDLESQLEEQKAEMAAVKKASTESNRQVEQLKLQLNDQEQYSRRNCIRVFGIQEEPNEDCTSKVITLAKNIGVTLLPTDIDRSHRVGKSSSPTGPPRGIIVKFVHYGKRSELIKNRRKLKGTKVVIKEDLTAQNQQLLRATNAHEKVKTSWNKDFKIFAILH